MVTADGRLLTCDPGNDDDSTGPAGAAAVATSAWSPRSPSVSTRSPPSPCSPWSSRGRRRPTCWAPWQHWMPGTPARLWSNCQLLSSGAAGAPTPHRAGHRRLRGHAPRSRGLLGPLIAAVGTAPTYQFVGPEPYLRAMLIEAGCEGSTVAQCHLPHRTRPAPCAGRLRRQVGLPRRGPSRRPACRRWSRPWRRWTGQPRSGAAWSSTPTAGRSTEVAADATAFVHRDALAGIQYSLSWGRRRHRR